MGYESYAMLHSSTIFKFSSRCVRRDGRQQYPMTNLVWVKFGSTHPKPHGNTEMIADLHINLLANNIHNLLTIQNPWKNFAPFSLGIDVLRDKFFNQFSLHNTKFLPLRLKDFHFRLHSNSNPPDFPSQILCLMERNCYRPIPCKRTYPTVYKLAWLVTGSPRCFPLLSRK